MSEIKKTFFVHLIAAFVGFIVTWNFFGNGLTYNDTVYQLGEARKYNQGKQMDDLHPPLMTYFFSRFDPNADSKDPKNFFDPKTAYEPHSAFMKSSWRPKMAMMVFQNLMFWLGLFFFARAFFSDKKWWGVALIGMVGFSLPIFGYLGAILKDVSFMSSLLLSTALITLGVVRQKKSYIFLSLPFIFYALNVRHNSLPALIPLSFFAVYGLTQFTGNRWRILKLRLLASTLLLAALLGIGNWFSYSVLNARKAHITQILFLYDLVGISVRIDKDLIPSVFKGSDAVDLQNLRNIYSPENVFWLFAMKSPEVLLRFTEDKKVYRSLVKLWKKEIFEHPLPYLKHRIQVTKYLFALPGCVVCYPIPGANGILEEDYKDYEKNSLYAGIVPGKILRKISQSFIFRGWFYLVGNFLGTIFCILAMPGFSRLRLIGERLGKPLLQTALVIFVSGLLYDIPYLFVSLGCDYRYHYWSVTGFHIAMATLVLGWTSRLGQQTFSDLKPNLSPRS